MYFGTERTAPVIPDWLQPYQCCCVCATLESTSGLEPSSDTSAPMYCLKLLSVYFDLLVDAAGVVCHQLGLLGTDLHAVGCGDFVEMLN